MNTFNLNLDLDKRGGVAQWVTMRQGDRRGTELRATIYDHGTQAGGGYTCRVSIRLPGAGDEYYRETATYTNGVAVVTVDEEYAAAIVGVTEGYFELLQGDAVIASTESFGIRILRSAQDGAVPGEKYDSAIEDALAELDEATGRISQMVVDATEEYLEAHPELTTTVEDNSLTDAKLIQHGGILDRVARLWHRLDNLLTATPAEADALTADEYILEKCGNYRETMKKSKLKYQVEYILAGKAEDEQNLEAIARRLIIIRFDHAVPEDKKDPDLLDKLRLEADGIFLFALEGLKRLMANRYRFSETEANKAELQQYREDSDSVLSFVKDCCETGDDDFVCGSTELFNAYKAYCEESGMKPYSQRKFIQQMLCSCPGVEKGVDKTGRRRVMRCVKIDDALD